MRTIKKHIPSYPVLLSIVAVLSVAAILSAADAYASDLTLSQPLASGVYGTDGGLIAQSGCVVSAGANVILIANHFSFQPGFQVPAGSSLRTLFSGDDTDGDGLTNYQESLDHTNPLSADTDKDGMPDSYEVAHHLNPLKNDASGDLDGDGFSNYAEYLAGSNPNDANSKPVPSYSYEYDALGRLTKVIYKLAGNVRYTIEYAYDKVGNRTSRVVSTP